MGIGIGRLVPPLEEFSSVLDVLRELVSSVLGVLRKLVLCGSANMETRFSSSICTQDVCAQAIE